MWQGVGTEFSDVMEKVATRTSNISGKRYK